MPVESTIQDLIIEKASATRIAEEAKRLGHITFIDIAKRKVAEGLTTPEEVIQVIGL